MQGVFPENQKQSNLFIANINSKTNYLERVNTTNIWNASMTKEQKQTLLYGTHNESAETSRRQDMSKQEVSEYTGKEK